MLFVPMRSGGMEIKMVDFGNKVRELRIKRGLNQTELAKKLGVTKSIISAYETQMRLPSLDLLIKISNEFKVSVEWLMGMQKNKTIDVSALNDEQITAVCTIVELFSNANKKIL